MLVEKSDASVLEVKGRNGIHEVGSEIKQWTMHGQRPEWGSWGWIRNQAM